jgi:hypothetical protein
LRNPWAEHVLPNWAVGNIARNFGTVLGLEGVWSLTPLMLLLALAAVAWRWLVPLQPREALFSKEGRSSLEIEAESGNRLMELNK